MAFQKNNKKASRRETGGRHTAERKYWHFRLCFFYVHTALQGNKWAPSVHGLMLCDGPECLGEELEEGLEKPPWTLPASIWIGERTFVPHYSRHTLFFKARTRLDRDEYLCWGSHENGAEALWDALRKKRLTGTASVRAG